jgi:hypothetical protein
VFPSSGETINGLPAGRGQIALVDRRVLESIASGTQFADPEREARD